MSSRTNLSPLEAFVAFVEEQVEGFEHNVQPSDELLSGGNLERNAGFPDFLFGPRQALGSRCF
jgi:hypothetical protein